MQLKVRVCGLLVEGDALLLAKHKREGRIYWVLPGGGLEPGESLTGCLRREMEEETGLKVEVKDVLFLFDVKEPQRHVVSIVFGVRRKGGELKPRNIPQEGERLETVEFVPLNRLEDIDLRPAGIKEEIEKALGREGIPYIRYPWRGD